MLFEFIGAMISLISIIIITVYQELEYLPNLTMTRVFLIMNSLLTLALLFNIFWVYYLMWACLC